jgi:3-oxoacyl-[acyl-carrier-protein] synthase II
VLERLPDALARGAKIYGELAGYAMNSDATDFVLPNPSGRPNACAGPEAGRGWPPRQIDIVSTHATGTTSGRRAGVPGAAANVSRTARDLHINNTKSFIGHAMGAAGASNWPATCRLRDRRRATRRSTSSNLDPECELPGSWLNQPREARVDHILNNSFGMLGINSVVVVKPPPSPHTRP